MNETLNTGDRIYLPVELNQEAHLEINRALFSVNDLIIDRDRAPFLKDAFAQADQDRVRDVLMVLDFSGSLAAFSNRLINRLTQFGNFKEGNSLRMLLEHAYTNIPEDDRYRESIRSILDK